MQNQALKSRVAGPRNRDVWLQADCREHRREWFAFAWKEQYERLGHLQPRLTAMSCKIVPQGHVVIVSVPVSAIEPVALETRPSTWGIRVRLTVKRYGCHKQGFHQIECLSVLKPYVVRVIIRKVLRWNECLSLL